MLYYDNNKPIMLPLNRHASNIAKKCIKCINEQGKILVMGNGGSASQASHFVAELVGRYKHDREALPAISLNTDTSILTALTNDYGVWYMFRRQLEALAQPEDLVITISTSGRSKNIIEAIKHCEMYGIRHISLPIIGKTTPEIQENHLKLIHAIAERVEEYYI